MYTAKLLPAIVETPECGFLVDITVYRYIIETLENSNIMQCSSMANRLRSMSRIHTDKSVIAWIEAILTQPHRLHNLGRLEKDYGELLLFFNSDLGFDVVSRVLSSTHQFDGEMFRLIR